MVIFTFEINSAVVLGVFSNNNWVSGSPRFFLNKKITSEYLKLIFIVWFNFYEPLTLLRYEVDLGIITDDPTEYALRFICANW